ncbi:MAG: signal peptidase I [Clostridia bacterium]|nr:signal peptidase I [Clostridia bacterium]
MAEKTPNATKKVASPKKPATKKPATKKKETNVAEEKEILKDEVASTEASEQAEVKKDAKTAKTSKTKKVKAEETKQAEAKAEEVKEEAKAEEESADAKAEEVSVPEKAPKAKKHTKGELAMLIVSIVLCCLMAPILIMNVVLIIQSAIHPNELPSIFGVKPIVVISASMEPDIKVNDLIFVKTGDYSNLKKGDVITFRDENGAVVTHEVYSVGTNSRGEVCYQTNGINNYQRNEDGTPYLNSQGHVVDNPDQNTGAVDSWITVDKIEGVYQSRIGGLGGFILWMQGTVGIIVCIGVPLAAFIVYELIRRNNELKRERANHADSTNELEELKKKLAELEKNGK